MFSKNNFALPRGQKRSPSVLTLGGEEIESVLRDDGLRLLEL
jgi:hypothetical protein